MSECLEVVGDWMNHGCALHLLDVGGDTLDTSSAIGRFFLTIMAGAAELERGLLGERIRATIVHQRRAGIYHAATTPWGYERVQRTVEERRLTHVAADYRPLEPEASLVRTIYEAAAYGLPPLMIADRLRPESCPYASGWDTWAVRRLLSRPVYGGLVSHRSRVVPQEIIGTAINVDPVVDPDLWQTAHDRLDT